MDLAAALGPERLREVMGELFNRCGAVTQRYGGTVKQFTGDGIMALFGAPIALEDHAIRACVAALEIQKEAVMLADEVKRRDGMEIALRVGLNSGDVVFGQIGSSSDELHGVRNARRDGAADGIGRTTRWRHDQRVHGSARRTYRRP